MRGRSPLITPKKIKKQRLKKQILLVGRASPVRWRKDPSVEERKAFSSVGRSLLITPTIEGNPLLPPETTNIKTTEEK